MSKTETDTMNATQRTRSVSTVMIVDDDRENLNVLEAVLSHGGYRVAAFLHGDLALVAAREEPPDLVLLDIRMPGVDGFEVCRRFKADECLAPIPILFISALSAAEDIVAGFACGGVDYIPKPLREAEVLARVRTHISLRGAYLALAAQHAQLQTLERHRDTLVHMLVHDMRSPLQVILWRLDMVVEDGAARLKTEELDSLNAAIKGAHVLTQMASAMIELSRMESGEIPLRRERSSVHELFHAARGRALDPSNCRRIAEEVASPCPPLFCDADLSVRVIANLLSNAAKFSPRGSEIVLGAKPDPAGVRIWVRDLGSGVPAIFHTKIFEKFGVAERPRGDRPPSTGLGLAFCKLVVEAQGGTIGIESEPDQGSTFWFTLPVAE